MDKKIFHYRPAELRRNADRWQVVFYVENPDTLEMIRCRETWDMNRIENIKEREKYAQKLLTRLNTTLLPNGYPYVSIKKIEAPDNIITVFEAFKTGIEVKCRTTMTETIRTYKGVENIFNYFLTHHNLKELDVKEFTKRHVTLFSDYLSLERNIGGRTHNKYLTHVCSVFNELLSRELVAANVWLKAKRLKEKEVSRRTFTEAERVAMVSYLYHNDAWLFRWVILQYYCFIRGMELRRLTFADINVREGYISLGSEKTKNGKHRNVTIPKAMEVHLLHEDFTKYPQNWLIFGAEMKPHKNKPVGSNTPNWRHKQALEKLLKDGIFTNIDNLSIYCWKYTGISDDLNYKYLDIQDTQYQAGHHSTEQTLTYVRRPTVNTAIRGSKKDIFVQNRNK